MRRRSPILALALALTLALALWLPAGASAADCPSLGSAPEIPAEELDASVFLIGDTGAVRPSKDPVLAALGRAMRERAAAAPTRPVYAVFLGDNIYPDGLPPSRARGYAKARARLDAQLAILRTADGEPPLGGIFVPGNHDWDDSGSDGLLRLGNQQRRIARFFNCPTRDATCTARLLPQDGCPGPVRVDIGERLSLVALDTQWWLHRHGKPEHPDSSCPADSRQEIRAALQSELQQAAGRYAVVVAHHPLITGGDHGGTRCSSRHDQDLPCPPYRELRQALESAFRESPPLLYASGHDHDLQLLRIPGLPTYQAVSGAGSKLRRVEALDETLFCAREKGLMRLDVARDRRATLTVLTLAGGQAVESGSIELAAADPAGPP